MDKTVKASIAGIGFSFEREAFVALDNYITKLEEVYRGSPEGREIVDDIEAGIVELILNEQTTEQVVSLRVIEAVIGKMGSPDDIEGEGSVPQQNGRPGEGAMGSTPQSSERFSRRLYRNPEGAKLGGVCNGLATYLGIDPVWVRLSIFLPLILLIILPSSGFHALDGFLGLLFGAMVLVYFIMWIVVPVARTPRQKLEMQGNAVNRRTIEQEVSRQAAAMPAGTRESASVMARVFVVFGKVLVFVMKLAMVAVALGLAIVAALLLVGIADIWMNEGVSSLSVNGVDMTNIFGRTLDLRTLISIWLGVAVLPMVMVTYQLIRIVFRWRNSPTLMWVLGAVWFTLFVFACALTMKNRDTIREVVDIEDIRLENTIFGRTGGKRFVTMIVNGDTILLDESKRSVEHLMEQLDKVENLDEFSVDVYKKGKKVTVDVSAQIPEDGKSMQTKINIRNSDDGDNQRQ